MVHEDGEDDDDQFACLDEDDSEQENETILDARDVLT